jgi:prepilin-type N-terminal cleavage/methylation domain-containing protein
MTVLKKALQPELQSPGVPAKNERGFTVLEVIIAVAVLGIGLVSAAVMQTRALEQSLFANKLNDRVISGESWMEELISRPILTGGDLVRDGIFADNMSGQWQNAPERETSSPYALQYRASTQTPLEFLTTIEVQVSKSGGFNNPGDLITFTMLRSARWN